MYLMLSYGGSMLRSLRTRVLGMMLVALLLSGCADSGAADLVLRGGKVASVDSDFSIHKALAVKDGCIEYVGSNEGVKAFISRGTRVIELEGMLVTPGMVDAHGHPFNLGNLDEPETFSVRGSVSWDEVVERVAAEVTTLEPGEWLIGGGWYQDDWEDNTIPEHDGLSAVSPDNPVFLYRRGGNSAFVNAKALEIAGIDAGTPDPYGGVIGRKADGSPSGFLVNMANNLVSDHFPEPDRPLSWYMDVYKRASERANEVGLTGWHDAGIGPTLIAAYKALVDEGELNVRVNAMLQNPRRGELEEYFSQHRVVNYGGRDLFQVRSVKVFFDGALGSRGAALLEPYSDDPGNVGIYEVRPEHLYEVSIAALNTGMQVCPHSIGSRAVRENLDVYERAFADHDGDTENVRFRVEHAELVTPEDVPRFGEMGVIPSVQPIHHTSDMEFLPYRLGPNRARSYASPWLAMVQSGSVLAFGSDHTIYSHNPLTGFYAAITRKNEDGTPEEGYFPEQALTRKEALKGYTIGPAYAAFLEDKVGSLEVGKYADLVVFDRDILEIDPMEILQTNVVFTIVDGRVVYENAELSR
jgi:predicted amidohydrolase YtcJ